MIVSYIKLSLRLAYRNPFFTIINVTGLAIGFAVFFVLWQYTQSELQSDKQWKDAERIARLGCRWMYIDHSSARWEEMLFGTNVPAMPFLIAQDLQEVEGYTRSIHQTLFTQEHVGLDKTIFVAAESQSQGRVVHKEENFICADANFFDFFGIPFVEGTADAALRDAGSIVISEALSRKYFGDQSALGKIVVINDTLTYAVSGVFEDLPHNTHLNFVAALSNASKMGTWNTVEPVPDIMCYIRKSGNEQWRDLEAKLNSPESLSRYYGSITSSFPDTKMEFIVQPLEETAFSQKWRRDRFTSKSKFLLNIFQATGVLVFVLALINYINLNGARVSRRIKEIATRKASGAGQVDFFRQFAIETLILFLIALGFAFTFIQLAKIPLQQLLNIPVVEVGTSELLIFVAIVSIAMVVTAAYPVWLSRKFNAHALFNPKQARGNGTSRSYFSGFQYLMAVVMIFSSIQAYRQILFVLSVDRGFRKEDLLVIDLPNLPATSEASVNSFINSVISNPDVAVAARSTRVMGDFGQTLEVRRFGADATIGLVSNGGGDEHYLDVFEIPLLVGRNFVPGDRKDVMLLSDVAVTRLGFKSPEEALGQRLEVFSSERDLNGEWRLAEVVGVFKNYNHYSFVRTLGERITSEPGACLTFGDGLVKGHVPRRLTVKLNGIAAAPAMEVIGKQYYSFFGVPMTWFFLEEHVDKEYVNDQTLGRQVVVFTILAVFIACLGLLGMLSIKVIEKTKEIGIRKVMGAKGLHVVKLLLLAPAGQLIAASLIGLPMAVYVIQSYFEKFTEHVPFIWWHLLIPGFVLSVMLIVTVFSTVTKAVRQNPVEALKYE